MANKFFVCALPRSRTAWFAVATSTHRSICYHEPTAQTSCFEDIVSLWNADAGISVGISDSGLALQVGRILRAVKPRTLMIRRPVCEVVDSLNAYLGPMPKFDYSRATQWLEECDEALEKQAGNPLVKAVSFRDLDDPCVMDDAMSWLLPNHELPDIRFHANMNIQVKPDYVRNLLSKSHTGWHLNP